jgi:TetR/AcrR family transcriptional regulator, cholesterol catabolism regulator
VSASAERGTPPEARPPRRRDEVLATAARLFAERGYAATSTTDIARELGMHRGSIYYYLSTKEDLLYELIQQRYRSGTELLERVADRDGDALARLRWLIEEHVKAVAENRIPSALALNESRSLSPERRASIVAENDAYERAVAALIAEGLGDGAVRDDVDPKLAAMALLGAANWLHRWYDPARGASPAEVARQFAAVFTRGLAPAEPVGALLDRIERQAVRIAELEAAAGA